jgi:hypothetical protein
MISTTRVLIVTAAAAAFAVPGAAQESGSRQALPKSILLARTWEEAIKEAGIRNVPILFTTAMAT